MMPRRLFISFSGGETSGFMSQYAMRHMVSEYDEVVCLFANTGQENEQTLTFVDQCDKAFSLNVVWVEADINKSDRRRSGFRVVNYHTACRDGSVFEEVIQQYGIPNPDWPHCTRELKTRPMTKYLRSIGWAAGTYDTAIGIRVDEMDRMDAKAAEKRYLYPLVGRVPMTKPMVNEFWAGMPFRLQLKGYQGNCKWCWKKSLRKHLTLAAESPWVFDFPERMEREYGHINPKPGLPDRVFFRKHMSTADIRQLAAAGGYALAEDDATVYPDGSPDLDLDGGCSGSCEPDFSETFD